MMPRSIVKFILLAVLGVVLSIATLISFESGKGNATVMPSDSPPTVVASQTANKSLSQIPESVFVMKTKGDRLWTIGGGPERPARQGYKILYNNGLGIEGDKVSGAHLGFYSKKNQQIPGRIATAGFRSFSSEYYYPCEMKGPFFIRWEAASVGRDCKEVRYSESGKPTPVSPPNSKQTSQPPKFSPPASWVGASVNRDQYCSAASPSGIWAVHLAPTTDDPSITCQNALNQCTEAAPDTCVVTSRGDWRDYDPKAIKLNLLLQCADNRQYYHQITGRGIYDRDVYAFEQKLEEQAKQDAAQFCVFNVYSSAQVLISPSSDQPTIIFADTTNEGFVIHDLVGTVTIRGSENLTTEKPIELKPGESYRFLKKTSQVKVECLSDAERKAILDLAIAKEFLTVSNWEPEIQPQIVASQKSISQQFYQPSAVSVTSFTIGGTKVWKATVDLTQPGLNLAIERNPGGSFAAYAKNRSNSLVMGGIHRSGNWYLISGGKFISRGEQWGQRYTVLGLTKDKRLEMITRSDNPNLQPDWNQYEFAVQSGPRLVRNGKAGVSNASAKREGHDSLVARGLVGSGSRRAAIGYSQDKTKLYYVIADDATLPNFAQILASEQIGCYDAMNLDGGDGPALAHNGSVKEAPGGQVQPFFILASQKKSTNTTTRSNCP
jgi:hypothetical protein